MDRINSKMEAMKKHEKILQQNRPPLPNNRKPWWRQQWRCFGLLTQVMQMDLRSVSLKAKKCYVLVELVQLMAKNLGKPRFVEPLVLQPLFDRIYRCSTAINIRESETCTD